MERKLILPAELKVCATCSYWDGERKVDDELALVVVAESCEGQCLVTDRCCGSLDSTARPGGRECSWEYLAPDDVSPESKSTTPEN